MNTELRKNANDFNQYFFKMMLNAVSGRTIVHEKKHRHIKRVTSEARRNYLVSEPNYHTTKKFSEDMKRTPILMNKPVYLGLSILEISKIVMHEVWYDNVKPKQEDKQNYVIWMQTALQST